MTLDQLQLRSRVISLNAWVRSSLATSVFYSFEWLFTHSGALKFRALRIYRYIGITLSDYMVSEGERIFKMECCTNKDKCNCSKHRKGGAGIDRGKSVWYDIFVRVVGRLPVFCGGSYEDRRQCLLAGQELQIQRG